MTSTSSRNRLRWIGIPVLLLHATAFAAPTLDTWLLVDTSDRTLMVMQGRNAEVVFDDIAIGRFGTNADKRRGDSTTPLGRFRVTGIRHDSDFHRFIALDYPDLDRSKRAHQKGEIDDATFRAIDRAHGTGRQPPQQTSLGGFIGVHGLGAADPEIHATLNWTRGCVALTNAQIDRLLPWVRKGMRVEIR